MLRGLRLLKYTSHASVTGPRLVYTNYSTVLLGRVTGPPVGKVYLPYA